MRARTSLVASCAALLLASRAARAQAPQAPAANVESSTGFRVAAGAFSLRILPYLQAQYENHQDSEDELSSDGRRLLNQDRFLLRRGRLVVGVDHRWLQTVFELDVNTVNGVAASVRQAEASLRWSRTPEGPPVAMFTMGLFRTPFGYETLRSARDRVFAENALVAQAFFPGESDLGARVQGSVGWFRYAAAITNGSPLDAARFAGQAPIAPRDVMGRLGVSVRGARAHFTAGVSALGGRGFHPGTAQGADALGVRDPNESGVLTPDSLVLLPGAARTRSLTFARFAAGADASLDAQLSARHHLHVYAEGIFGQNMDRGLYVSDPVGLGYDVRGLGFVVSAAATLFDRALLGARVDWYNPNADATANAAARVVSASRDVLTASFLAGFQVPGTATRVIAQYDLVRDHLALGVDGLPADLANNRFTLRLQVSP